ncbi:hypothetical protein Btru_031422 [Bulinus truncatus]|nr:hypothetical protein Btru_031422 [Bulinus truncatus]
MRDCLSLGPHSHPTQTASSLGPDRPPRPAACSAADHANPMLGEWRRPLDPNRPVNLAVENYLSYLRLLCSDSMGCQQSHSEEPEEDSVESLRYSRRSTKIKRSKRKKLSKTKSGGSEKQAENGPEQSPPEEANGAPSSEPPKDRCNNKKKKKNNERALMFGNQQSIKNVLTLAVDTPEAAEIEAKQGKFGSKHVFPIWESHYSETCKCVNAGANEDPAAAQDSSAPPHKPSPSSDRRCKRCSQLLVNNRRGVASNNNNSSNSNAASAARPSEPNGSVGMGLEVDAAPAGGGPSPADPNSLTSDPLQTLCQQTQIAAIANLLVLVEGQRDDTVSPFSVKVILEWTEPGSQSAVSLNESAALELSVPASNLLVKNRKNAWIQLAGHPDPSVHRPISPSYARPISPSYARPISL